KPKGASVTEKRAYAKEMRDEALSDLYSRDPSLKPKVRSAAGYAVFSNLATGVFFVSTGQGYGIAHDNRSGKDTYMRMGELGGGYVLNAPANFMPCVDWGWECGADANVAAMANEQGVSGGAGGQAVGGGVSAGGSGSARAGKQDASGVGSPTSDIEVYELTEN